MPTKRPYATIPVLDDLGNKGCKPDTLLADTGYGRGRNIVDAPERGVDLVSPSCGPKTEEGDFMFSADGQRIEHCPMGQAPEEQGTSAIARSPTARQGLRQGFVVPTLIVGGRKQPSRFVVNHV